MTCFWVGCFVKHAWKLGLPILPLFPQILAIFFSHSFLICFSHLHLKGDCFGGMNDEISMVSETILDERCCKNASHYQYCISLYYGGLALLYSLIFICQLFPHVISSFSHVPLLYLCLPCSLFNQFLHYSFPTYKSAVFHGNLKWQ